MTTYQLTDHATSASFQSVARNFQALLTSQVQSTCLLDSDLHIQQCSPALLTLLDTDYHALKDKAFRTLNQNYWECLNFALQNIKNGELTEDALTGIYTKDDDSNLLLNCRFIGIHDDLQQLVAILVLVENQTEKAALKQKYTALQQKIKENEKELNRYMDSNMQLEHFAYIASHDLREPLRTIGNFAQLLERKVDFDENPTAKEYLSFITEGVQNMHGLVNDLLTYSRVNTQETDFQLVNVADTLSLVKNNLQQSLLETNTQLIVKSMPNNLMVNSTKLKQIFQNLISNAIKFKQEDVPPVVNIRATETPHFWNFSVKDNGIGIDKEYHKNIFLLFSKLNAGYAGTGIGLALCEKIVKQHGGKIWLESEVGKGSTFHFSISKHLGILG